MITGNGKGKTTAAFGQALRAIGQGYKVFVLQFMKGRKYGEFIAAEKYLPNLTIRMSGLDSFVMRDNPAAIDIELAQKGLEVARKAIMSDKYNMIILDEINVALDFKLIKLKEVIELIKNKPPALDLILTGRYAPKEIIKACRYRKRCRGNKTSLQCRHQRPRGNRILNIIKINGEKLCLHG